MWFFVCYSFFRIHTAMYLCGMLDYIVVGLGLAGVSFCETLRKNNKTFVVFNDGSQTSSRVAGGLYNPVILKRFTLSWKATEQLEIANKFYPKLENRLGVNFNFELPVLRRFTSIEEQNLWFEASDKPNLSSYLSTELVPNKNKAINASLGYGEVLLTGRLDTQLLMDAYQDWLMEQQVFRNSSFQYDTLEIFKDYVIYDGLKAKHIVFAEGFGLKQNPYFNYLPMQGSKGEYVIVKSKELQESKAVKSAIFLIPLGDDLYKAGANYNRDDKTNTPTVAARQQLVNQLEDLITCDYEIISQVAGVRPTVRDRRPLLGQHPKYANLWVLNGFGSHGIMIAPWASGLLYDQIENQISLNEEINIDRFKKLYKG
ncbi:NAD(P)/FAD-dependent oxidoreductase [Maribacter sp. 2210JD10-5]|uniref:NAD(P)/FAD-dependent oxidoreductase n=1 Tax=Maribacter sp. 2210JD10-5 TaxID=3386272 RepID=UPI0039BCD550